MTKLEGSVSIGSEIKDGLIEIGRQLSNAVVGGRSSTEMSEVAELLKEQAKQSTKQVEEMHTLLRMLMQVGGVEGGDQAC
jgi:hypothetical protein